MRDCLALLSWQTDTFAYAESFDEAAARYRGLRGGQVVSVAADDAGLLVKPDLARRQMEAEVPRPPGPVPPDGGTVPPGPGPGPVPPPDVSELKPRRYHGTVTLDPARVGRDAGRIAEEVIAHLSALVSAEVRVTLEIEAEIPSGAPDQVVRTVTENGRTLRFIDHGFERE